MDRHEEYEFWIDAYSPDTISMKRLGEYMTKLGKLLGQEDRVHFYELRGGSTAIAMKVECEASPKIRTRIDNIKISEAANDPVARELNDMLRADNAIAELRQVVAGQKENLLKFAGREVPKPQKVGPFSEPATIKGLLVRLEGKDTTKHVSILDAQGKVWAGAMSLEVAVQCRELMFEHVAVEGVAKWIRSEDGTWSLVDFNISSCKPLENNTLKEDINALRSIEGNQWKTMDDPIAYIHQLRHDDEGVH